MATSVVARVRKINIQTTAQRRTGVVAGFNYVIGVGLKKITVGTTEPVNPKEGDLWIDTAA